MRSGDFEALEFWRKPIEEALRGEPVRIIDTQEHTAQLSHKDQRDDLWSKTEQYELRFQDLIQEGQTPVDILSLSLIHIYNLIRLPDEQIAQELLEIAVQADSASENKTG